MSPGLLLPGARPVAGGPLVVPGRGGLAPRRPDQLYTPPSPGVPPGAAAGIFRGRLVVVFGTSANGTAGIFVYSSSPAFGNLIGSTTSSNGFDRFGNAYIQGTASYNHTSPTSYYASVLGQGLTAYYFANGAGGPWVFQSAVRGDITTGVLTLQSNTAVEMTVPVWLDNIATPAAQAAAAVLFGGSGQAKYVGTDGNAYNTGQITRYNTAAQTISATGMAPVTWANGASSLPVNSGAYRVKVYGSYFENQAAGVPSFQITGPATTNVELLSEVYSVAGASTVLTNRTTALGTPIAFNTMTGITRIFNIEGLIVLSAAGNIQLQAATSINADSFNIQAGTFLELIPVT